MAMSSNTNNGTSSSTSSGSGTGAGSSKAGTSSTSGSMASSMGAAATASGGPSSNGNGGGNAGGQSNAGSANAGQSAAGSAASSSAGDSKQNGGLASGAANAGNTASSSTTDAAGGRMSSLQSSVSAARDARNQSISGTQRGIANAVADAFGGVQTGNVANQGTTAPNATPGQRDAYNSGYRNETNAGMTRAAFGALPGVGSLVGEGIARTAMSQPTGLADNEAAAYSSGVTGAKSAGVGNAARSAGSLLGGVLGGPIGSALASMAIGGYSYSAQRAANPQAFANEAQTQSYGPVTSTMSGAMTDGNSGNVTPQGTSMLGAMTGNDFSAPSDYSNQYNSYQNMNLGRLI